MTKIQRWFADDLSENYEVKEDGQWVKWGDVKNYREKLLRECMALCDKESEEWTEGSDAFYATRWCLQRIKEMNDNPILRR